MNNIDINFTPAELNFTSLCVKAFGRPLKEHPDKIKDFGLLGAMMTVLSSEIDMDKLFQKFEMAMLNSIMEDLKNQKY